MGLSNQGYSFDPLISSHNPNQSSQIIMGVNMSIPSQASAHDTALPETMMALYARIPSA